jgi:hypothetical protein
MLFINNQDLAMEKAATFLFRQSMEFKANGIVHCPSLSKKIQLNLNREPPLFAFAIIPGK